jgi:nucleoid-associated protein YgaU
VRLKEWREPEGARKAAGSDKLPTTHRLTAKDTLHSLSVRYYHSALYATDIAAANGIRSWGKATPLVKSARFKVGSKIKIPKVYKASVNPHPKGRGGG